MATHPTKFDHKLRVTGQWRSFVAMWVRVQGQWRPVTNGWSRVQGAWRPWVATHPGGGTPVHPPTVTHTKTLQGSYVSSNTWSFTTASYKARLVSVQLIVTTSGGLHHHGAITGYPSGGTLGTMNQDGSSTKTYTMSLSAFKGATHGVHITASGGGSVTRVQLRIRYT